VFLSLNLLKPNKYEKTNSNRKKINNMKVAIIRFTENTGRTYIVDITNDVDKWLIDNNSDRDEDDHEELISFDIEWTTLKIY
tara:strand:+ start:223 stop:468 length:246 start_codon:yes stop_codon:yes gene_type:complete